VSGDLFFFSFSFSFFSSLQAREAAKSGLVLFHEAMEEFWSGTYEESFERFEGAAAKGHEESIWILGVVKDVEMKKGALKEAFDQTETPLGWYFAGMLEVQRKPELRFGFVKKSAEAGCSWGQVECGVFFRSGQYPWVAQRNLTTFREWMEKAAKQSNPKAVFYLGKLIEEIEQKEKSVPYYLAAAELGWKGSFYRLSSLLREGKHCPQDWRQALIWGAKCPKDKTQFWIILRDTLHAKDLDCDFHQLCYSLGWGLYWYVYETENWHRQSYESKNFGQHCLDYYCTCVELQRKSILTFLWWWKQMGLLKDVGLMIAKRVWEEREDNLVKKMLK
jgi:hypothetical protein